MRSVCWGAITDTIFFETDFLHLGAEKGGDDDEEEKAERPRSLRGRKKQTIKAECIYSNQNQNRKLKTGG